MSRPTPGPIRWAGPMPHPKGRFSCGASAAGVVLATMYYTDDSLLPENMQPLIITAAPYGPAWLPGDAADIAVTWDDKSRRRWTATMPVPLSYTFMCATRPQGTSLRTLTNSTTCSDA